MDIPLNLAWLESTSLAAVRMTAFLFLAPPFSFSAFPARVKAMLAVGLSLAVSPAVSRNYHTLETPEYLMALVLELVVGAVLGLLVMLVFSAIQSAGSLIDLFGGFFELLGRLDLHVHHDARDLVFDGIEHGGE